MTFHYRWYISFTSRRETIRNGNREEHRMGFLVYTKFNNTTAVSDSSVIALTYVTNSLCH